MKKNDDFKLMALAIVIGAALALIVSMALASWMVV